MPYTATNTKKFLDSRGLTYFSQQLNNYPDNTVIEAVVEGIQDVLDEKLDITQKGAVNGVASLNAEGKVPASQLPPETTYEFDGTYNPTTNKIATVGTVSNAVNALTGGEIGESGTGKTITSLTQTAGNVSATFENISIVRSQIRDFPTLGMASTKDVDTSISSSSTSTDLPTSSAVASFVEGKGYMLSNLKGSANGVAELDTNGKVPSSQLPSYVDDVLEFQTRDDFPSTGESGKIYVNLANNATYRWSGSTYVLIGTSLTLGETSSTAYRGDYGKAAYDHAYAKGSAYTNGLYKFTTNQEGHVTNAVVVNKSDITGLGIPSQDTTYTLRQDSTDRHKIIFEGSDDSSTTITIPDSGSVTSVSTGAGLTGGPVTTTGTIKVSLTDETNLTNQAAATAEVANRIYPVRLDKNGKLAVVVPWAESQSYNTSIAVSEETSQITLAANTKYAITAGGSSYVFTTPPNVTYSAITDSEIEAMFT